MEKLNCKSLMIGDYVVNTEFGKNKIDKIETLEPRRVWLEHGKTYVPIEYIEPVPLTTEILEKNGFYYGYTSNEEDLASSTIAQLSEDDKGWCWDEGDGAIKVIFPNETDGGLLILDDQSFDRHLVMGFGETIFLHELQNALRLCVIKKEIEL